MRKYIYLTMALLFSSCSVLTPNRRMAVLRPIEPVSFSSDKSVVYHPDSLLKALDVQYLVSGMLDSINTARIPRLTENQSIILGIQVAEKAKEYIGCKYAAGQMGPKRFDCSGLTSYVYNMFGVSLHRSSGDQWLDGKELKDRQQLRAGDLVYFNGRKIGNRIGHVGIVTEADPKTGEFYFVHASVSLGVMIDHSSHPYYKARYQGARRIFIDI